MADPYASPTHHRHRQSEKGSKVMETNVPNLVTSPRESTVSFVIVTFNSLRTISSCLKSVLAQSLTPAQTIIVDNASTDGTLEIVQSFSQSVNLVSLRQNVGFAAACNIGAKLATGELIAFVNPDAYLSRDWLESLVDYLGRNRNTAAATSRIYLWKDKNEGTLRFNAEGNQANFLGFAWCRNLGATKPENEGPVEVIYPSGAAMVIWKSAFNQAGGFDEDLFLYHDDFDLGIRLRLHGWRTVLVPKGAAFHDYDFSRTPTKLYYLERNRLIVLAKMFRVRTILRILPAFAVCEVAVLLDAIGKGWFGYKVKSYLGFFQSIQETIRKRRQLMTSRTVSDATILSLFAGGIYHPRVLTSKFARAFNRFLESYRNAFLTTFSHSSRTDFVGMIR